MTDYLSEGLSKLNFEDGQIKSLLPKFDCYIKELNLFNSAYNLVNTDDYDEIAVNHILDSLSAVNELKSLIEKLSTGNSSKNNLATENSALEPKSIHGCGDNSMHGSIIIGDIGSGGGLPGIPLAAAMPDYNFVLVERMSKRCAFLENCAAIMGLSNVTVKNIEAEKVKPDSIDIAVFRAFRPLDKKMIKTLLSMIVPSGFLAAYKAKKQKITEEMNEISSIVPEYTVKELYVPFLTDSENKEQRERNLVIIQKPLSA